jgi:hypothetical protein
LNPSFDGLSLCTGLSNRCVRCEDDEDEVVIGKERAAQQVRWDSPILAEFVRGARRALRPPRIGYKR